MADPPAAPEQPARRDRRRMLVLIDVAGFVLVCGLIVGGAVSAGFSAQTDEPYPYAGLTPFIVSFAFGLPIVPVAIASILFGLIGGRRVPLVSGRWAGFRRRAGQLTLASIVGCFAVVVLGVIVLMIYGVAGGDPLPAISGALGLGGIALAVAFFVAPALVAINVAVAALARLVVGGPAGNATQPKTAA